MFLKEIWRYPVKSMAGEQLNEIDLGPAGIPGDRILQVRNHKGRIFTSRTRPRLLLHHAIFNRDGDVLVDHHPWNSLEIARAVEEAAGEDTHLVRYEEPDRFDILPLLIVTDGMLTELGYDTRRFRPNLVIGDVPAMAERDWEGAKLRIGTAVIALADLRARCIMTTFDPDTGIQDLSVLRRIQKKYEGVLGLNASVAQPGLIKVGDAVELIK